MVGRSSSDLLYAGPQVSLVDRRTADCRATVGRSLADQNTLQLIKVIGEVSLNVIASVGKQKLYLSANKHAKFLSAIYRPIVCLYVIKVL